MRVQIAPSKGAIFRGKVMPGHDRDAVWVVDSGGPKEACVTWVHIGATWRTRLNRPCSAAVQKRLNRSRCRFGVDSGGMGPRNHVLDGVLIVPCQGTIFRGKDMPGHTRRHSAVSCVKMGEKIEMPFGLWTRVGPKKHEVHTGGTWRIPLNRPCAAVMRPFRQISLTICLFRYR